MNGASKTRPAGMPPGDRPGDEPVAQCTLEVAGMDCASCAEHVEKALRRLDGVESVGVDVVGGRVTVAFAQGAVAREELAGAIRRAGYQVAETAPARPGAAPERAAAARSREPRRREVLAALAGVFWALSLAADHLRGREGAATVLAVGAMVAAGWYIVPRGIRAALDRSLDMNSLMSLAAVGALLIGEHAEAASVLFLFAVAELLESRSMDRARGAIRSLMALSPAEATVLRDGVEVRVPVERIAVGDIVVVRPGEKIPVDGTVVAGRSAVNQAPITGEGMPVDREPGDEVYAGTLNGAGALEVRSARHATDTTLARIIHSVEAAQASRAPSQRFVDRFARIYTPAVLAVALGVFVVPPLVGIGTWGEWFYRALVLLVVACPCALVISTPVTVVSALAGAARRGILIKGGLHLENAGRARTVALDKTGTLTEGRPEVVDVVALGDADPREVLALAAAVEARGAHPLARAVLRHAEREGIRPPAATATTALVGRGLTATVDGRRALVGSEPFFRELGALDAAAARVLERFVGRGITPVLVGAEPPDGGRPALLGILGLADRVRASAPAALAELRRAGIRRIVMLTGDHAAPAAAAATELGAVDQVLAGLLPDDKVAAVHRLRAGGERILMVGDGVNDAPALAAADVGIAMGSAGSDVALETADIALMTDDLARLPETIRFARKAEQIIRANIALSILTKATFVALAIAGLATLWMAVLADMGTSLIVIGNGLRALRG